nr:MAG TPA: hypothetical protein [Caudoviricetes sp.]
MVYVFSTMTISYTQVFALSTRKSKKDKLF